MKIIRSLEYIILILIFIDCCTQPSEPNGFTAIPVSSSEIDLRWNATLGAVGYDIFYCDGTFIKYTIDTSYKHNGRVANTKYSYKIDARNSVGCVSSLTVCISATTLMINNPIAKPEELNQSHEVPSGPYGDSTNYVPPSPLNKIK